MADRICEELLEGRSLRSICRDAGMPHRRTVFTWLTLHEDFRIQYTRAREMQAETLLDETLDIADDSSEDFVEGKSGPVLDREAIARSKLRIDTRKWLVAMLAPKKYRGEGECTDDYDVHVIMGGDA